MRQKIMKWVAREGKGITREPKLDLSTGETENTLSKLLLYLDQRKVRS
jgi:hypothetical protein